MSVEPADTALALLQLSAGAAGGSSAANPGEVKQEEEDAGPAVPPARDDGDDPSSPSPTKRWFDPVSAVRSPLSSKINTAFIATKKRERAKVDYDEAFSDDDEDEGEKDDGSAAYCASSSASSDESGEEIKTTTLWPAEANAALSRGLRKFPILDDSTSRLRIQGRQLSRRAALSEYIRRQTGLERSEEQVKSRIAVLRETVNDPSPYIRRQTGLERSEEQVKSRIAVLRETVNDPSLQRFIDRNKISKERLESHDWDREMGPDLFSQENPPTASSPPTKKRKKPATSKRASSQPTSSSAQLPRAPYPPSKSAEPSPKRNKPPSIPFWSSAGSSYPSFYPPQATFPTFPPRPSLARASSSASFNTFTQPRVPLPCRPASATLPQHPQPAATGSATRLQPSHLAGFLNTAFPSHDFTSSAFAFHTCGLTSPAALTELLLIEDETLDDFFKLLSSTAKLSGIEAGWAKKALKKLRAGAAERTEWG